MILRRVASEDSARTVWTYVRDVFMSVRANANSVTREQGLWSLREKGSATLRAVPRRCRHARLQSLRRQRNWGMGMPDGGFAIIDFETTGLFHGGNDRVIEVAVVHTDRFGNVTGAWETLVNPGRDLGRQDIHGISAAEILAAPTFRQIAPKLVALLSGRVIVAHNARFDTRFLLAELNRAAYSLEIDLPAICTMQLAKEFIPGSGRSLADCCAAFDIELIGAHRASVDAFAT